jgi:hypothetical protein
MPAIRLSKQSAAYKLCIREQLTSESKLVQLKIDEYNNYVDQLKQFKNLDDCNQIKYLKRIKRRLPAVLLPIIHQYLTRSTVDWLRCRSDSKLRLEYFVFYTNNVTIYKRFSYTYNNSKLIDLMDQIPIHTLDLFVASNIVVNTYRLVKRDWESDTRIQEHRAKEGVNRMWIYKYIILEIIERLHAKIEDGDIILIPITRRLVKSIQYLHRWTIKSAQRADTVQRQRCR